MSSITALTQRCWRKLCFSLAVLSFSSSALAADLSYYLPQDVSYNPDISTPEQVLGYQVGEWHVRHDQLVRYMEILAEQSDRITLEVTGRTHEQRPLLLLTVTSANNHANIDDVRQRHLAVSDATKNADTNKAPLVYYMGYSIHGDESSGSNAALLFAYYLAAAEGDAIEQVLQDSVILLDPSLNPDGLARFASWANQHRSQNLVSDPQSREHVQGFPRGRVNHYWFDLNRDWLLLQHPESRARIANFQKWMPNILTDFHEMGTDSTFFFQPGIPSRTNPLTPEENQRLTQLLAEKHAAALDKLGNLYFTKQAFDDFYVGKGSTYPDIQGAVGILFEQGSSRGHLQESINGELSFPFTIRNQFITSLTTVYGAHANKQRFLDFQQRVFKDVEELADDADFAGYLFGSEDATRLEGMLDILRQHHINAYRLTDNVEIDDRTYRAGESYYVPLQQRQYTLIRAIFNSDTSFPDNTFYDVSGWTLPMAFNVQYSRYDDSPSMDKQAWAAPQRATSELVPDAYAYAFNWQDYAAPALLQDILEAGIHARQTAVPMTLKTANGDRQLAPGAVLVTHAYQQQDWQAVQQQLAALAKQHRIELISIDSGLANAGADMGSRDVRPVNEPAVMMLVGSGVNQYEAGEAWYYLDRHVGIPLSMVDTDRFSRVDLNRYSHILLVDGSYYTLSEGDAKRLAAWVKDGGVVIAQQGGAEWLAKQQILQADFVDNQVFRDAFDTSNMSYADRDSYYAQRRVAGAIFELDLDNSHPLTFGFPTHNLPVFKNSLTAMTTSAAPFIDVARYTEQPLLSGYAAKQNRDIIAGKTAIVAHRQGQGRVIAFADDINFRAYFWGTAKLLSNAIYLAPAIEAYASSSADEAAADEADEAH
ncbi:M14 family metallopeptidase [Idiomarina xiamenensis]|uniref:Zinc-dependent carboxypeptidase domain-containing protein n=1 Tax=Idiomarina xiamenensis 10-D-4 TaxID=740709 RepID=K2K4E6_9GAMM|nr:M14 family metallopeptidase [Idiomarina xiamenensis]EKE81487.1 zinc-dependent carboxypeptidase domain-containing protein [Idiomarina xiamenensis 10-D-4]